MTQKPLSPDSQFFTESHGYALSSNLISQFWNGCQLPEIVCDRFELDSKEHMMSVYELCKQIVKEVFGSVSSSFIDNRNFYAMAERQFLLTVKNDSYRSNSADIKEYVFEMYGSAEHVKQVRGIMSERLSHARLVKISWYYKASRGIDSASLHVNNFNQSIKDAYYPWFPDGVDSFVSSYFENNASVLVLYGPPGTGKTSFLRHMLTYQGINAAVTYDEKILKDDSFFVSYLTDEDHNALIVEDADVFLSPRDSGDNDMMSKFLNVSDGLIKISNKKLIFTTNISQLNKIDSALLRVGRCFAAVEFRELTPHEAARAAEAAGLEQRDWHSQECWSLAQLFNNQPQDRPSRKFRVGFS